MYHVAGLNPAARFYSAAAPLAHSTTHNFQLVGAFHPLRHNISIYYSIRRWVSSNHHPKYMLKKIRKFGTTEQFHWLISNNISPLIGDFPLNIAGKLEFSTFILLNQMIIGHIPILSPFSPNNQQATSPLFFVCNHRPRSERPRCPWPWSASPRRNEAPERSEQREPASAWSKAPWVLTPQRWLVYPRVPFNHRYHTVGFNPHGFYSLFNVFLHVFTLGPSLG
jgi:hypothetical protein